jgi:hypothetical protein
MTNYYVKLDSYWQNSPDYWFGPYATFEEAYSAVGGTIRPGQAPVDIKTAIRSHILNTTGAYTAGMHSEHLLPALMQLPNTVQELHEVEEAYS